MCGGFGCKASKVSGFGVQGVELLVGISIFSKEEEVMK